MDFQTLFQDYKPPEKDIVGKTYDVYKKFKEWTKPKNKAEKKINDLMEGFLGAGVINIPKNVAQTFWKLGDLQRGLPEIAMTKAQHSLGGGVMPVAIEHTGDLTHRMTNNLLWDNPSSGYGYVKDKVDKVLDYLKSPYGFQREYMENLKNNAEYRKVPFNDFYEQIKNNLGIYAKEHSKLPVYNEAQWNARNAAINLGRERFPMAQENLEWLKQFLKDRDLWDEISTQYKMQGDEVQRYPW